MRTIVIENLVRWWPVRGGLAIADQALFAGSNFALNVYLARSLPPSRYGVFTFTLAVFLALFGLYNALHLEPATVLGPSRHEDDSRNYVRAELGIHFGFTGALGIALVIGGLTLVRLGTNADLGLAFVAAGIACPLVLLHYLARRLLYVRNLQISAVGGSLLYACALGTLVFFSRRQGGVSAAAAFGIQALASAIGCAYMVWRLQRRTSTDEPRCEMRTLMLEQWHYGKWLVGVVLLQSASVYGLTFVTTAMLGFGAVGILRAMQSFVLPFGHAMIALFAVAQPMLARDFGRGRLEALGRKSSAIAALIVCIAVAGETAFLLFHRQLEYLLFGGKFAAYSGLIPVFGAAVIFEGLAGSQALVLRAVQRPRLQMFSVAMTTPLSLATGFLLIRWGGIRGAALATAGTWLIAAIVAHPFSRRWFRVRATPFLLHPRSDSSSA